MNNVLEEVPDSETQNVVDCLHDSANIKLQLRFKELEINKLKTAVDELREANRLRKSFAIWAGIYVSITTLIVLCMVFFKSSVIKDTVLIAMLTTFMIQVVGVVGFVMAYLFKSESKPIQ